MYSTHYCAKLSRSLTLNHDRAKRTKLTFWIAEQETDQFTHNYLGTRQRSMTVGIRFFRIISEVISLCQELQTPAAAATFA